MLLANTMFHDENGYFAELCIVPEDNDKNSAAFLIGALRPRSDAVYYIGPKEALTVNEGPEPGSVIITSVPPATIYLTPNTPEQPGIKVYKLLILPSEGMYRTYYLGNSTESEWREWIANKQRASD